MGLGILPSGHCRVPVSGSTTPFCVRVSRKVLRTRAAKLNLAYQLCTSWCTSLGWNMEDDDVLTGAKACHHQGGDGWEAEDRGLWVSSCCLDWRILSQGGTAPRPQRRDCAHRQRDVLWVSAFLHPLNPAARCMPGSRHPAMMALPRRAEADAPVPQPWDAVSH